MSKLYYGPFGWLGPRAGETPGCSALTRTGG